MTRNERLDAALAELDLGDDPTDTGSDTVGLDPERFLLVENNLGLASAVQPHYFTTHATLEKAGEYHAGNEYGEDWQLNFALDLDTGERYQGDTITTVKWVSV